MSTYIIKLPCDGIDYYLLWSSIVDAPVTVGMTMDEFMADYKERYGTEGMDGLPARLERVEKTGTSDAVSRTPVRNWIEGNRAGELESELSFDEIVDAYIRQPRAEETS